MRRRSHPWIAALFGVVWGLGLAVLLQQFGVVALDPQTVYLIPFAAALLSGARARIRKRRAAASSLAFAALIIPVSFLASVSATCGIDLDGVRLSSTSFNDPFVIGEDLDRLEITIQEPVDGRNANAWVEIGAFHVWEGPIGEIERTFVANRETSPFGSVPGLYHIGVEIEGICSDNGYIRFAGNPIANPVGVAASAAVFIGLIGAWWAGLGPKASAGETTETDEPKELPSTVSARATPSKPSAEVDVPSDAPIGHSVRFQPTFDAGSHVVEEVIHE